MELPEPLKAILNFAARVLTGIVLFIFVGLGAVALNLVTSYGDAHRLLPPYMLMTMKALEYVIFAADVIVFLVFLMREALGALGALSQK